MQHAMSEHEHDQVERPVQIYVDKDLPRLLRVEAAHQEVTMQQLASRLLREGLCEARARRQHDSERPGTD